MNTVSFTMFSILKLTLKAVSKQIKVKQQKAVTGQDFWSWIFTKRKKGPSKRQTIQLLTFMGEKGGGVPFL